MSIDDQLREWSLDPTRPVMVIDERRVGAPTFAEERIVFAGVLTTIGDLIQFGAHEEGVRREMDEQKSRRALKAKDVLSGRCSKPLQAASMRLLQDVEVSFWATSEPYLRTEFKVRGSVPIAIDQNSGEHLSAKELPVFQMIPGLASGTEAPCVREVVASLEAEIRRGR